MVRGAAPSGRSSSIGLATARSGHCRRHTPGFRIGPERAADALGARRCRWLCSRCANSATQRNFATARTEPFDYFGKRAVGLPLFKAAAAGRRRRIAARQPGPTFSRRQNPQHSIGNRASFRARPAASFSGCGLSIEQSLNQRPLVVCQIVEHVHVLPLLSELQCAAPRCAPFFYSHSNSSARRSG
ncbi:hypothetical protein OKW39_001251 [Paraburkholderia sp. MM6662-R1]